MLVVGTDSLSEFILRGFSSLLALSPGPCRPFDRDRDGLSLGEAAGAILLTADKADVELAGWGESNDANHITGPSRDGQGLFRAASTAIARAGLQPADVDIVHAHGTGTRFNDEMESHAMTSLFSGATPPCSGTKAQTGHTLGRGGHHREHHRHRGAAPRNGAGQRRPAGNRCRRACDLASRTYAAGALARGAQTLGRFRRHQCRGGVLPMKWRAVADAEGVRGHEINIAWRDLGIDPSSGKVKWVLDRPFPDFRRLDPLARFCCLAAEAIGMPFPIGTAIVLTTTAGCLHADRKFQDSLATIAAAGVFPYTLPSTCLGDVAIRNEILGPVLCFSTADGDDGIGRIEAQRLMELEEAPAALVLTGNVVPPDMCIEAEYLERGWA